MASSRLYKLSSVFERMKSLYEQGAVKDKPLWYDVYAQHPPSHKPGTNKVSADIQIRPIFYEEDVIRAKVHKQFALTFDLSENPPNSEARTLMNQCRKMMEEKQMSVDEAVKNLVLKEK